MRAKLSTNNTLKDKKTHVCYHMRDISPQPSLHGGREKQKEGKKKEQLARCRLSQRINPAIGISVGRPEVIRSADLGPILFRAMLSLVLFVVVPSLEPDAGDDSVVSLVFLSENPAPRFPTP
ncbi:hypothetical protein CH63R_00549 [Colletotrichum higginsianum IMI 349063]|uniref:Uncharacterized protein n=1 Tax=Colletotrichum higginsianum (strain IMI 349063) TaxID=759273 RepID=A0A1B7YTJ7_COLHI|nr:hypothetical protein CH63R_00549 [Colletotrichum higginsianum IMI 349063]OBR15369.1 hypothetical protein CH63R_00549 [Colletotrichum higginsianum IMI 349063]